MKKPAKRGTGGPANPPLDDPEQSRRFEETANEIGVDESGKAFRVATKKLLPRNPNLKRGK